MDKKIFLSFSHEPDPMEGLGRDRDGPDHNLHPHHIVAPTRHARPPSEGGRRVALGAPGETAMSAYKTLWLKREQRDHAAARAAERETATPEARDASASEPVVHPNQQPLFAGVAK